jgi:hypothetical protein
MWYIYILQYYSAIKKNETMSLARKWDGTGDYHAEQNKPGLEKQVSHVFTHMWNLDQKINNMTWL